MKALVTGGKGFIGSHIVDLLRERGHETYTYDLRDGKSTLDAEQLYESARGMDVVFGCAGKLGSAETFAEIESTISTNVTGTLNVLEACRRNGIPLVYISLKNEWLNPYMISKHTGTHLCEMYNAYCNTPTAVMRGLNAYGPGQHWGKVRKVIPTFIVNALENRPLMLFGDGKQIIDLIYVRDMAEIMVRMWERGCWGAVIDGGTGVPVTVEEVARKVIELVDSNSVIEYEPMRKGEPQRAVALADPAPVRQLLDYYPETDLYTGLAQTVAWYREHYKEVGSHA
jgi:UDP-glucose 4-epimerase